MTPDITTRILRAARLACIGRHRGHVHGRQGIEAQAELPAGFARAFAKLERQ